MQYTSWCHASEPMKNTLILLKISLRIAYFCVRPWNTKLEETTFHCWNTWRKKKNIFNATKMVLIMLETLEIRDSLIPPEIWLHADLTPSRSGSLTPLRIWGVMVRYDTSDHQTLTALEIWHSKSTGDQMDTSGDQTVRPERWGSLFIKKYCIKSLPIFKKSQSLPLLIPWHGGLCRRGHTVLQL